jgi:NTP pyrophosphatase (non-canonical NTP hydrolase)
MMGIFGEISVEVIRQDQKHPADHIGLDRWTNPDRLAILTAEVGEVAQEVTRAMRHPIKGGVGPFPEDLRTELVQVAACAVAWIDALDKRETKRT